jgi:anaerobic selenocysteine-containing dehydrogenase
VYSPLPIFLGVLLYLDQGLVEEREGASDMTVRSNRKSQIWEDVWINTVCYSCYGGCAIRVRRINGVAVKIEGFPESTMGGNAPCGKGVAGLMYLYDPNRIKTPLRRMNPEKGIGVDPMWKEISWEEALDEISERLKKIRADNPKKLWVGITPSHGPEWVNMVTLWARAAFHTGPTFFGGGGVQCGNATHLIAGLFHAAWSVTADWKYTKYVIKWGSNKGTGSGHSMTNQARLRAQAMERGVKEVVFDPMCNLAGGKATDWIPILPGTDSAVALAMANYIVNELKTYDTQYLRARTNLPYLIAPDGCYVRDSDTNKPLVWDAKQGSPKVYDDPSIGIDHYALEGTYEVEGVECRPAFVSLREHLKKYTAEWAFELSGVPVDTIRRIAGEWVENACIGSTIVIEGRTYPHRPVASIIFRGGQGHTNSVHQVIAVYLLNVLVGAQDVPGGALGWPSIRRPYPGGQWEKRPCKGADGVIIPGIFYGHEPWPLPLPSIPATEGSCSDYWTATTCSPIFHTLGRQEIYEKLDMTAMPEMVISAGVNFIVNHANCREQVELWKEGPFVVHFDLFSNETAEAVADLLLPDQSYLEKDNWKANLESYFFNYPPAWEDWWQHTGVPVAKPVGQSRHIVEVLIELADKVGFRAEWNKAINMRFGITDERLKLKPDEKLSWHDTGERVLEWMYGAEGLDRLHEKGFLTWHKPAQDTYWRWDMDTRVPIYMEFLFDIGKKAREIGERVGLEMEWEQYTPLVSYFSTIAHKEMDSVYDLLAFSYRDILHTNSATLENPWLNEVSELCPYTYTITINTDTAKKKGLKDGDVVWLETHHKKKERGILKLMEGQHPQTVGIAGQAGLWAKGRPIAKGKGSNFDLLLESDLSHLDPITLSLETSTPVKVYRDGGR